MKFGAFILTFNRPEILSKTITAIIGQTLAPSYILVVDNGSSETTKSIVNTFPSQWVEYYDMKENRGPAGATAFALHNLVEKGFDWIYWVDDDDPPIFNDTLERLLKIAMSEEGGKVGGIGGVGALFDWSTGVIKRLPDDALSGTLDVDYIGGNQQLILNSEMVREVGVADERLFFGLYEPEYCLRIRRAGYRLLVDGDLMRRNREHFSRLNLRMSRSIVPSYDFNNMWQRYYRTRNYIFMMRKTFNRPDLSRREMIKSFGRIVTCWVRGPKYALAFSRLQLRGIVDGYLGRLGRTVMPKPKYPETGSLRE